MVVVQTTEATEQINRLKLQLSQQAIGQAMARAINRTILHERTISIKAAKEKYRFPEQTLRNYKQFRANYKRLEGYFSASAAATPLHRFPTQNIYPNGISVRIMKGKASIIPYAFRIKGKPDGPIFARGVYGGKGFQRTPGRKPIAKLQTLSLFQAIAGQIPRIKLQQEAKEWYDKTFRNELNYQVLKATGKL